LASAGAIPIIGGTVADDPAVVPVEIDGGLCTGTFLAPDLVLTAGHCVTAAGGTAGGAPIAGAEVHPDADLAVLFVDPADRAVHPWSDASSEAVAEVRVLGYGQTAFGDPDSAGVLHEVTLPVRSRTADHLVVGDPAENTCQGDSGGPAFADGAIVAVVSFGDVGCTGDARLARLDAHAGWLADFAAPEPTGCCSASGDPGGAALLAALAYAALVGRYRGRRCSGSSSTSSGSTISPRQVGAPQLHGSAISAANA